MSQPDGLTITTLPNGLKHVLSDPACRHTFSFAAYEIFSQKSYERPGYELAPNDNVIDIGGHLGAFVLWAAPQVPEGKIVCVEPTANIKAIEASVAANALNNVITLPLAAGKDGTFVEMVTSRHNSGTNHNAEFRQGFIIRLITALGAKTTHRKYGVETKIERVPAISLASIIDQYFPDGKINFLKVDCEGAEFEIFEHLPESYFKRIEKIVMEFHHFHKSHDYRILKNLFEKNSYEVIIERNLAQRLTRTGHLWASKVK